MGTSPIIELITAYALRSPQVTARLRNKIDPEIFNNPQDRYLAVIWVVFNWWYAAGDNQTALPRAVIDAEINKLKDGDAANAGGDIRANFADYAGA